MPDNIPFNTIPVDIRTPGQYIEVDNSKAIRGLPSMNRRMLFIGNKLAAGTAVAATLHRINSPSEAATLFGKGSVLYEMLVAARNANKESDISAMALADDAGGTAHTKTVTFTGPATEPGTLAPYINGHKLSVGVSLNDTATTIATAAAAAFNAWTEGPMTATSALGVVTLTARHKGAFGNDIDVRFNYFPDEKTPAGVTVAVADVTPGAGNPDVATALAAISE